MIRFVSLIAFALLICGCTELLIEEPVPSGPLQSYDVFGQDFAEKYGLFEVRNVDWPVLLEKYRAPLALHPTEDKLYDALTGLILELDDSHVSLSHPTGAFESFTGGIYGKLERLHFHDMDFELVKSSYLSLIDSLPERIYYGTVAEGIGYIYLPEIHDEPGFYSSYMPLVLKSLDNTHGIIVDVRNNTGGEDESSCVIAGFFADGTKHFMTSRYKVGPRPTDFSKPRNWYVKPSTGEPYLKPVVLLTNRYSVSSAEVFTMAMTSFGHVVHLGDTTAGAFSDAVSRQLPNGWGYSLSVGDYRTAENVSFEGIGLAPEVLVENTPEDIESGVDRVLEAAIAILK